MAAATMAAAQAPADQKPPSRASSTVTGCLTAGEQPGTFLLTDATWDSRTADTKSKPAQPHGADPATPAAKAPAREKSSTTLRLAVLTARPTLGEHVGRTVTLSGTLAGEDRVVTPGIVLPERPAGKGEPGGKPQVSGGSGPRILSVSSVVRVGEACK